MQKLFDLLLKIDGKSYSKFRDIEGSYGNDRYTLHIDSVQGSPVSEPSRMRITISGRNAGFPEDTYNNPSRKVALGDLIARRFWESARTHQKAISFPRPGQEILERGSVSVADTHLTVSFGISLPAASKNAAGKKATDIFRTLDEIIDESLFFRSYKRSKLYNHIEMNENAEHVRSVLDGMGLCAFVANGSVLPRREDGLAPMINAIPFFTEDTVTLEVPNGEAWIGLGVKKGFTVVTGASFSGKSTFIDSIAAGVYNHIPGDGREKVITISNAMFTAKQERPVHDLNVSATARIGRLNSEMVKGPLAESAALSEALEIGCRLMIADEDSSSSQIICHDPGMASLVSKEETIIPLTELPFVSVIVSSTRDAVISVSDNVLICGDVMRCIEQDVERSLNDLEKEIRCPLSSPGKDVVISFTGMKISKDQSYARSLRNRLNDMREKMDGQTDIRTLCSIRFELLPNEVKVCDVDLMMALNRSTGITMVRRT